MGGPVQIITLLQKAERMEEVLLHSPHPVITNIGINKVPFSEIRFITQLAPLDHSDIWMDI
jgi:hypothetical protein